MSKVEIKCAEHGWCGGPHITKADCPYCRIEELQQWVNDLQSGLYINCVYCGHNYGPKENTPAVMADVLKEHIEKCPQHPLSAYKKCIEEGHDYGDEPDCSCCGHYGPGDREHQLRQRIEELEKHLSFIGDMAVTNWDDKEVGAVDAVVKEAPKSYAEWARDIYDVSDKRKKHTMALDRACEFVVEWLMNRLGAAFSVEEMVKYLEEVRAGEHDDFDYESGASSLFGLDKK